MNFSQFSKQKFGENQNKTTFIGAVTGLQGQELSAAHQRAQQKAEEAKREPSVLERVGNTLSGAGKGYGAGVVNLGGSAIEGLGHLNTAIASKQDTAEINRLRQDNERYQQMLDSGKKLDGTPVTEKDRKNFSMIISRNEQIMGLVPTYTQAQEQRTMDAAKEFYDTADSLTASAQRDIEQAKKGLGAVGRFAVDAGVAGAQMAGDIGLAALTGGSALVPMAARSLGSGMQEARQEGATFGQQMGYGLGSAALSVATEKISNVAAPFRKAFGAGVADKLAGKLAQRFGESTAVKTLSRLSRTAAGRMAASALGEGSEELVEAVFQPVLQRATFNPDARFDMSDALYQAAVGAALGGIGGAVDVVGSRGDRTAKTRAQVGQDAQQPDVQARQITPGVTAQRDPRDVDLVANVLRGGQTEAQPVRTGRVTTIQHPYQGKRPIQAQKITASVSVDSSSVLTAQNLIDGAQGLESVAPNKSFKTTLKNAYKEIFKPAKNVPVSGVTFDGKPYTVDIPGSVPGKVISDPNLTAEKLALLDNLPQVVQNGEYVGSGEYVHHGSKIKNTIRYDYFETPVTINGQDYIAKFDVEVLPMANNYRTHQLINMDLTTSEAKLTGRDPALSSNLSGPVEGTRPLNSDSTIPQGTNSVNEAASAAGEAGSGQTTRGTGALDKLGVYITDDMGNYNAALQMRSREAGKKSIVKARRQAERRLNPTRGEKNFAKGIAEGDYTTADIPASMNRATVEELADYYTAENSFKGVDGVKIRGQEIREETEELARELVGEDAQFNPMPMLLMNERTPERVMRSLFGDLRGEQINQRYIYPVQQNEAEKIRFVNRMLDTVRTVTDSSGRQSPLTQQDRSIVQQMLEDRFVGETVASMEVAEGIRNAAVNIKNGKDAGDAAREFSLRGEEVDLARQLARWMENQEMIQSGQFDSVKIQNAVEAYSRQYDLFYDAINDFLTAHGYSTIGFIKGYAPHMQKADTQTKLSSALQSMGVNLDAMELPTSISGRTADYKPGKRWNPFFQTRHGNNTDYDVAAGYESYVTHLADILYHTDDIARLRGLSRYLRKTYGPEEISNAIDHAEGLRNMETKDQMEVLRDAGRFSPGTTLTPQDARAELERYIDSLYEDIRNVSRYGEFVKYIDNYANLLAGKQSMADRGMEYTAGRNSLNVGNRLVSAFARAQVAGNLSSALNQSAQLPQLLAEVDLKSVSKAAASLVKSTGGKLWNVRATDLFDQSDLLTTKKGIEYLTADESKLDRLITTLFKPLEMTDSLLSALTVQSKYEQLRGQGMSHEVAMDEANRFAQSIMGSRARGSRPLSYESKSLINQMLHMFQTEAVNSWDHIASDLPRQYRQVAAEHGKQAAGRAVATVAVKGLLSAFLLNRITEAAYGGTPAPFDVLGYIANFVASGSGMSTNAWLASLLNSGWEKLFGEPLFGDDDEREEEEQQPFAWGQATDDLVYNLLNDIPFVRNAAGLLGLGDQTMPLTNIAEAVQGVGEAAANSGVLSGETGGALLTLGASMLPGGRQLQKTGQGIQTILDQGRVYGIGDEARLQYPVERDPFNIVQAVLFGNSGLAESREFYASGNTGLSAKQTQLVNNMGKAGADRTAVYDAIQEIRNGTDTAEKIQALTRADLSDQEKVRVYANVIAGKDSKQPGILRDLLKQGISWDQLSGTYPFESSASGKRYAGYIESGLTAQQAGGLSAQMETLQPESGKETVSDLQRYRAVVDYGLSPQQQLTVLQDMMEDSEYESLLSAYQKGIQPGQFITFREEISGLSADKDQAGKSISGSKKRKVLSYIDSMDLNNDQKTALYYAAGYAASTLDDAPWYGRPDDRWNIVPRLDG